MYSQSASLVYLEIDSKSKIAENRIGEYEKVECYQEHFVSHLCSLLRPCKVMAAAPHFSTKGNTSWAIL